MKLKYHLDHPQIKRNKSVGNGSQPSDIGASNVQNFVDKQDRKAAEYRSQGRLVKGTMASNEARDAETIVKAAKPKAAEPVSDGNPRLGERPSPDVTGSTSKIK
jgi:hypothetical protein